MSIENDMAVAIAQRDTFAKGLDNMTQQRNALLTTCKDLLLITQFYLEKENFSHDDCSCENCQTVEQAKAAIATARG